MQNTFNKFYLMLAVVAATPVFAQDQTAEAVGAGIGLVIGLGLSVIVGAVVGWVASLIVKGTGSGLLKDILIGIGGSMLAGFVLPALGISVGDSIVGALLSMVAGAVILLLIIKFIRRSS